MRRVVPVLMLLVIATAPLFAADQKKIDAAIKRGGEYLKAAHAPAANYAGGAHGAGTAALSGLGMLEAGVKPDDPSVKNVAAYIRAVALSQTETYHTSLCILFLDRLGDPADVPIIQMLGVRLYGGITPNGGWTYHTWEQIPDAEVARLRAVLAKDGPTTRQATKKDDKTGKDDGFLQPSDDAKPGGKLHPEVAKTLTAVKQVISARGRTGTAGMNGDDNSNTQFGIIGLWVAARNGLPAKDAFALVEARFLNTQSRADGGWGYQTSGGNSTVAMTCAGLIGLAVGGAAKEVKKPAVESKEKKDAGENDPFFNPKGADGEKAEAAMRPRAGGVRDKSVEAALVTVGAFLGGRQRGSGGLNNFIGAGNSLYMLWSIERMAVAYSLDTVGGIDWYDWGSDVILNMQGANGSFSDSSYGEDINTAFAILFLAKANFTKDLSAKNKGKDPGKVELRGGGGAKDPLMAPPKQNDNKAARGGAAGGGGVEDPARPGGFSLPKMEQPTEQGEAEKVAKALTAATTDADYAAKLTEARDAKGAKWTKGLVLAAARLDGDKRVKAREALADRLTRMTPKTLREMLQDPEAELRRAACLACAMRDEKEFLPDLIERITDPSDLVVRAAKAGLVSFANTDFGPKTGADQDAKAKAAAAWSAWYDTKYGKK